jgi:hypothetical protein
VIEKGATVVQFGPGHQIANLVTRVQIPAVALSNYGKAKKAKRVNNSLMKQQT